ncbi:MAG TPA: hypothetical protein VFQ74_06375 [Pseudolysinimonas sp.]|nr:hypothetical protein [Pseudolysinimonas sp.]
MSRGGAAFAATPYVAPVDPSWVARAMARFIAGAVRVPGLRSFLLLPVIARPGYWLATLAAFVWGCLLLGHWGRRRGLYSFVALPSWSFGRGGTTVGAIYLTSDLTDEGVLEHELVHTRQWKKYGLCFLPLYLAAGANALGNRFEVEAGLGRGGYL